MSFEIKSPCRSCPQVGGTKEVCSHYCPEMHAFKLGLMHYNKLNVDCYAKIIGLDTLPLSVADVIYSDETLEVSSMEETYG